MVGAARLSDLGWQLEASHGRRGHVTLAVRIAHTHHDHLRHLTRLGVEAGDRGRDLMLILAVEHEQEWIAARRIGLVTRRKPDVDHACLAQLARLDAIGATDFERGAGVTGGLCHGQHEKECGHALLDAAHKPIGATDSRQRFVNRASAAFQR